MTETTEQRIERVARALWDDWRVRDIASPTCRELSWEGLREIAHQGNAAARLRDAALGQARAADVISFAAGWDAAVQFAALMEKAPPGEALQSVADYLAAHRPGETT